MILATFASFTQAADVFHGERRDADIYLIEEVDQLEQRHECNALSRQFREFADRSTAPMSGTTLLIHDVGNVPGTLSLPPIL